MKIIYNVFDGSRFFSLNSNASFLIFNRLIIMFIGAIFGENPRISTATSDVLCLFCRLTIQIVSILLHFNYPGWGYPYIEIKKRFQTEVKCSAGRLNSLIAYRIDFFNLVYHAKGHNFKYIVMQNSNCLQAAKYEISVSIYRKCCANNFLDDA